METKYGTERFDKEHRHFGGIIYPSDFNTDYRGTDNTHGSPIASRIASDFKIGKKVFSTHKRDGK